MTDLRVGIVGCGWVGRHRHLPAYLRHRRVKLVGVADAQPDRAREAVADLRGVPWLPSIDALLDLQPDAVSICTPPWEHARLAIAALNAGAHVLTEKPMAMSTEEARRMIEAAKAADRQLCTVHNFLTSRAMSHASRLVGALEEIEYVSAVQLSSMRRRLPTWYELLPGGLLFDELPHMLYMTRRFLGELQLDGVRARWNGDRSHLATCEIQLRGARAHGQVLAVFDSPVSEWHVVVVTRRGVVDVDLFREFASYVPADGSHGSTDILRTSVSAIGGHAKGFVGSGVRLAARRLSWGHEAFIGQFVDAVLDGGPLPVSMQESLDVVALTDDILRALV